MKIALLAAGLVTCLLAGLVVAGQDDGPATETPTLATSASFSDILSASAPTDVAMCRLDATSPALDLLTSLQTNNAEPLAKKCSFNSDCSHGKCKSSKCGGCSFNSDCKGWGKCGKGQCGSCSFDSECKGFGKCSKGKCTKSPYK